MIDELYPLEKPKIHVNGKKRDPSIDSKLKGKTLEVYNYFVQNEGEHGIREIQSDLNYSSPSISQYHVQRLVKHNVLIKTENNRYRLKNDWLAMGSLEDHFKFLSFWIPRSLVYALVLGLMTLITSTLYFFKINSYNIWGVVVIPTTIILTIVMVIDSIKLSNKISK